MLPSQALTILDEVSSQVQASRSDHQTIQNAIMVLQAFIKKHEDTNSETPVSNTETSEIS